MKPMGAKVAALLLALAAAGLAGAPESMSAQPIVTSGHRGAVLDIAEDSERRLLLSVGEDGFLRVWDKGTGILQRKIAVTRQKAASVALDPRAPFAAVLVTDGLRSFTVEVWDWEAEKRLYSIPLQTEPLFVRFSRSGTYLFCGDMRWKSLHIIRVHDGSLVPFHPEGFGMVGFADSSRNDATLMTYQLSGTLAYWDIGTGNEIKEMPTAGGLVNVRTSDDRSSLVGQSGPEVIGIDAVSGETRFRTDATGIVSMDISGDARKVACLFADGSLQLRDTVSNAESAPQATGTFAWRPRLVRLTPDAILLAGDAGGIGTLSGDGRTTDFTRDILAQVSSMAARDGALALAAGDVIHIFLIGGRRPATSPVTESFSVANPFPGPVGLVFLGQQKLAVWKQGDSAGSISVIDLSTRRIIGSAISFDGALAAVAAQDDQLFVLEKSGEVVVLNPETGEQFFKARWPGADCVAPFGPSSLVLGGLSGGDIGGSLVRIDLRSGETVPLPGSSTITFALAADPAGKALYFLGVSPDDQTTLTRYEGTGLQRATVVDSAEGEFLSTSLSIDPVKDYLYTSLGREEIKAWTGKAMQRLAESARATLALAIMQGLLVSLERDSSVSLWDTAADQAVGQIYPFADGSWAAVMTDGTILGSLDGREKVGNSGSIIEKGRRESDSRSPSGEIPYSMMTDRGGP